MSLPDASSSNSKKLKILHVITHFELGGAEKCTFELGGFLGGRVDMAIAAVLGNDKSIVGAGLTNTAREYGATIFNGVKLPWKFGGFLFAAFKLRRIIRDFKPDIIHLNTEVPEFTYILAVIIDRSISQIPVIRTIHNTVLWTSWKALGSWCEKRLSKAPVIYVSNAVRDCFLEWRNQCGITSTPKSVVIYNPISVTKYRTHWDNPPINKGVVRLLFAGRFEYQKGSDLLPIIVKLIQVPENTKLSLSIYGEGTHKTLLEELRNSPPPGWEIEMEPPKPNLVDSISNFDILLFPSRFEGYGRLAAEAVLLGIPVVAFRLPVLLEIFPADYPWLVSFSDENFNDRDISNYSKTITMLINTFADTQAIVDRARNLLEEKLDPNKMAFMYLRFYKECANTSA